MGQVDTGRLELDRGGEEEAKEKRRRRRGGGEEGEEERGRRRKGRGAIHPHNNDKNTNERMRPPQKNRMCTGMRNGMPFSYLGR